MSKVEPPNWWPGHSINPVRVLIRGRHLTGARVEAVGTGLQTGLTRVNAVGTYVFVDVMIDPRATPSARRLRITTPAGMTEAAFEITAPLARAGRFQGFSNDDVMYLIMPDRFSDGDAKNNDPPQSRGLFDRAKARFYHGGDFRGIINRLPYLKDLGVTALWLNPWYDNVNQLNEKEMYPDVENGPKRPITDYHGYGAIDFYGVEERFGTLAELRELIDKAHAVGIKIIQDQVANHSGPYHPWVKDTPTPTWYNGTEENHLANSFQTWALHDPNAAYKEYRETMDGWFINILPDFNQRDEETTRYHIQNTLWWIGVTGLDAIRQDTWQYVPDHFWHDWMNAIKREYPNMNVVGEVLDGDPAHVAFFQGGRPGPDGIDSRLDTLFDFPLFYPIRRAFGEGQSIRSVAQALAQDHLYPNPDVLVTLLGNHDVSRFMNEKGATAAGLKLAQVLIMTTRGAPQLYYGDEIAIGGGNDPDNRRDFPGGFPGDQKNAFTREGRNAEQQQVFEHVRQLTRTRAELEPLRRGRLVNLYIAEQQYAYARMTPRQTVLVVFNNDTKPATFEFDMTGVNLENNARLSDRLGIIKDETRVENGMIKVTLPARSASVLAVR
ncbi:MAG: alpha-amylase family glycosyl hydrolase [Acidobacteriota bacterium]|nr:alpha-amylase family glycosyl hydrolase [Acidobacteriota bacterium]